MFPFTNNGGYWLSPGLSPLCSDSSSGSEEEAGPGDDMSGMEHWMSRPSQLGPAHLGSTSSSSSSTQSGGSGNAGRLADSLAHAHISHLAHTHLAHTHLGHHQQSHLSQSHHGKGTTFYLRLIIVPPFYSTSLNQSVINQTRTLTPAYLQVSDTCLWRGKELWASQKTEGLCGGPASLDQTCCGRRRWSQKVSPVKQVQIRVRCSWFPMTWAPLTAPSNMDYLHLWRTEHRHQHF